VNRNTNAGFLIATATGTGANADFNHNLGTTPEFIIRKRLDTTDDWTVYTTLIDGSLDYLRLNLTDAKGDSSYSAPTSTTFTVPGAGDYVFYSFASVSGYSKFGTYTGNGSTTGPTVTTGFKPAFIVIKRTDSTGDWRVWDSMRDSSTPNNNILKANSSEAEAVNDASAKINFLTTGFQPASTHSSVNTSGATYLYWAISE